MYVTKCYSIQSNKIILHGFCKAKNKEIMAHKVEKKYSEEL